ncbi:MAG: FAD-binding oxidoreductase [Bacteroidia bacterium]|nr:FAD-binding oxidoreductase [Bacteroidia bacterium]
MMMELSFWEAESFIGRPDVLIIGSGIVGLNAAIHLKKNHPHLRVLVVERGPLPSGASTRNAGFACFGSMTELLADLSSQSEEEVFSLVEKRWQGLGKLRSLLGDKAIGYEHHGGYEVFTPKDRIAFEKCRDRIVEINRRLAPIIGEREVFRLKNDHITSKGFSGVENMILNVAEGQIHTGKMMETLLSKARALGVEIINGLGIRSLHDAGDEVEVKCDNGWEFFARRVLVATNGFARRLFPDIAVNPARNQVWVTEPVAGLKVQGCFHYDEGYVYFRNVGNRLLIGGARNLDFSGEATDEAGFSEIIQNELQRLVREMILPGREINLSQKWSGIMGLGHTKKPIVEKISPNIAVSVRLGGMGVAIGTQVGQEGGDKLMS